MVVLWTYFKYLKIHLALTYRNIFLRFIEAFIDSASQALSIFIIFAPDVICNSFWYLVEVKQNEDFSSLCGKINEVLARIDEETHDIRDVNPLVIEVVMQNLEKTQKNIIQGYINCQSTIKQFSFLFFLNHASAILIKISRKCGYRLSWKNVKLKELLNVSLWKYERPSKSSVIYNVLS